MKDKSTDKRMDKENIKETPKVKKTYEAPKFESHDPLESISTAIYYYTYIF